ncbi:cytidine deaminase (plasmid) [Paraclostridium ghonii]|uniref:cytidine deaminase n=1 Tax=Paraclostridium ghonii TaxID=29358 RepID=UPI00202CC91F|nr:cytidine deaminase [Paeniclostridium ghonii]MCM0165404.1 cytidine deaminase [Paeniclostridium ghonii]
MTKDNLIETKMYQQAIDFIPKRYPTGWGGVAVIRCEDDQYFTSVSIDTANSSVDLCIEVGAMCDAHKYNVRVTHCLCVVRDDENSPFKVLSPCGVCQERLRFWGTAVKVGVTTSDNSLKFVTLNELQPYHWTNAYPAEKLEQFGK